MRYRDNKKRIIGFLISFLILLLAYSTKPSIANSASEKPEIQNLQQEIAALEETKKILSDEKERKDLILQLENLLVAKKEILAQKAVTAPGKSKEETLNLIQLSERLSQHIQRIIHNLEKQFNRLPTEYAQMKQFFSKKENLSLLFDVSLKFLISLLLSVFLWVLFQKLVQKWKISFRKQKTISLVGKIKTLLFNVFLKSYYLAILFFFSWFFLKLVLDNAATSAILYILGAWFVYQIAKSFCCFILSPKDTHDQLLQINDQLANYILIWCRRVLLFSLWIFIFIKLSSLIGLIQVSKFFSIIYRVGLLIMLAIILAQWKENIRKLFSLPLKKEDSDWKTKAKKIYNQQTEIIYPALILYFSGIVLAYILGYKQAYQFLFYATLKSFLVIALAILFWFLWQAIFQRLFAISEEIKQRYPTMEEQVNQYIPWFNKLAQFSIILFTVFILLYVWGLDIPGFLSSYSHYISRLLRIPLIIVMAVILVQITTFLIQKMTEHIAQSRKQTTHTPSSEIEKQMATISGILRKSLLITIWVITAMMILNELGFSIGPLLAGAGIAGVAVGFGSQNLVRDIISGLFMITENQVRVGDVAILNGTGGLVEQVNLRTTVLRGLDGTVHIFPNGSINTVSNMTHDFSFYLFNIGVAYKEDTDRVCAVLMEISDQIIQEEPYKSMILEPLEILGLDKFADSAVIIKARIKTQPIKQWQVGREMNRRIKKRFDEKNIEIPFPHRTFYFGEVSKPVDINIKNSTQTTTKETNKKESVMNQEKKEEENNKKGRQPL